MSRWVRVRLRGVPVTQIAREPQYADPRSMTRAVQRLEAMAGNDRELEMPDVDSAQKPVLGNTDERHFR